MIKTSDILILGATGLTGRQITKFLSTNTSTSRKFTLAIAARSKQKLQALVLNLSLSQDIKLISLDVTNEEAVNQAVEQTRVVVNTVGPYHKYGEPVVKACVRNGVHYVDLTGELLWIAQIIRKYDYQATKTHSIIVPSCGFDSVPSDLSVWIASKALKQVDPSLDIASSVTVFDKVVGIISSGTLDSAIGMRTLPTKERNVVMRDYLLSPVKGLNSPRPQLVYNLQIPSTLRPRSVSGSFWFMSSSNRAIVQRSWGLLEQEALQRKSSTERYGPSMVYDEFLRTPGRMSAAILSVTIALVWGLLGVPPFRWLIRNTLPSDVNTTSDERLEKGSFRTINVTVSTTSANYPNPVKVTTTLTGKGDPGYLLSPLWVAECALALLDPESLPERARQGGVLTPATAFGDVLVKRIQDNGRFTVHHEVHDESKKSV